MANDGLHKTLGAAGKILKYLLPVAVSTGLVIWLFHRINIHEVMGVIKQGCDFRYIALMMLLTMVSFIFRGVRWGIQLRGVGIPHISPVAESVSIFGAYAMNLLFPFIGEAWRCLYMSKRTRTPLTTIVGTDVGDRISDAIVIGILSIATFIVARPEMMKFLSHYNVGRDFTATLDDPYFWAGVVLIPGAIITVLYHFRRLQAVSKIEGGAEKIWNGFAVLFHLKGLGQYLWLTLGIWACYFLETYACFMAFPFTRALMHEPGMAYGLLPALVVFIFGSWSVAVPSNGGLGPWNISVMFALSLFSVPETQGAAYGLVAWSFQTLMIIILGIFSMCYISSQKRSQSAPVTPSNT